MDFNILRESVSAKDFQKRLANVCFEAVIPPDMQTRLTGRQKKSAAEQIDRILSGILNAQYRNAHDVRILFHLWDSQETLADKLGRINLSQTEEQAAKEQLERARALTRRLLPWIREVFEEVAYKTAGKKSSYQRR